MTIFRPPVVLRDAPLATTMSRPLKAELKEIALPALAFLGIVLLNLTAFTLVILSEESRRDEQDLLFLGMLWITTIAGVIGGQLVAVLRIRSWLVAITSAACWIMSIVLLASMGGGSGTELLVAALFFFPFFLWSGVFSLRYRRALAATWVPLMYGVASCIVMIDDLDRDGAWFEGEKHAIWDLSTFAILAFSVVLLIVYLAVRERHYLVRWQQAPKALVSQELSIAGSTGQRLTMGGRIVIFCFAVLLAALTAFASPYLWRTGRGDEEDDDAHPGQEPSEGPPEESGSDGFGEMLAAIADAAQQAVQSMVEMVQLFWPLILLLLVALAAVLASIRPLRRVVTVHHYRSGLWPVPATATIENAWKLVEIGFRDHGISAEDKETATRFVQRALTTVSLDGDDQRRAIEMAACHDRVTYALGVAPSDSAFMKEAAGSVYASLRRALPRKGRAASYFRRRP